MRNALMILVLLCLASTVSAQTPTVSYDYSLQAGETLAIVQAWTPTLYVNGTAFTASHTCVAQPAPATALTCSFPLPTVSAALTASGPQTFEVSLRDAIVGEGPKGAPFIRVRPHAPTNSRTP